MKVVILCGGTGNRIAQETKIIPKPMIKIGGKPILVYIMEHYLRYGFKDFILACGYKKKKIRDYFKGHKKFKNVRIIDTGIRTLTGKRIHKLKSLLINEENFMLTYGDGISNLDLNKLLKFHINNKKVATVTAVNPPSTFGVLKIINNKIKTFSEKKVDKKIWINGGFFVLSNKVFDYLSNKDSMLEDQLMKKLVSENQIKTFKHHGFWKCLDNYKDKLEFEEIMKRKSWLKK